MLITQHASIKIENLRNYHVKWELIQGNTPFPPHLGWFTISYSTLSYTLSFLANDTFRLLKVALSDFHKIPLVIRTYCHAKIQNQIMAAGIGPENNCLSGDHTEQCICNSLSFEEQGFYSRDAFVDFITDDSQLRWVHLQFIAFHNAIRGRFLNLLVLGPVTSLFHRVGGSVK